MAWLIDRIPWQQTSQFKITENQGTVHFSIIPLTSVVLLVKSPLLYMLICNLFVQIHVIWIWYYIQFDSYSYKVLHMLHSFFKPLFSLQIQYQVRTVVRMDQLCLRTMLIVLNAIGGFCHLMSISLLFIVVHIYEAFISLCSCKFIQTLLSPLCHYN